MNERSAKLQARNRRMYADYVDQCWSLADVADEYGLHLETVRRIFHQNGWPRRPSGMNTKYLRGGE